MHLNAIFKMIICVTSFCSSAVLADLLSNFHNTCVHEKLESKFLYAAFFSPNYFYFLKKCAWPARKKPDIISLIFILFLQGESADVICESDRYWEWCRWIHMDHFCDFEWVSLGSGVQQIGCDFPQGKVEFIGDYEKHQCGLRIHDLNAKDRGIWMCEMEKYYSGFSRR